MWLVKIGNNNNSCDVYLKSIQLVTTGPLTVMYTDMIKDLIF